jgi:hypothetical protein
MAGAHVLRNLSVALQGQDVLLLRDLVVVP